MRARTRTGTYAYAYFITKTVRCAYFRWKKPFALSTYAFYVYVASYNIVLGLVVRVTYFTTIA